MTKYLYLILALILSSCASLPPPSKPQQISLKTRQQQLAEMNQWNLQGLIAIHSPQDTGSVNINWQQNDQSYLIFLFGPMGANAVQISGKPGSVSLQDAQGKVFHASNPEQLLYSQTGWQLPVSNLYYWARGLPVPQLPAQSEYDAYHRLTHLHQNNWHIWYKQYALFKQRELPSKIVLTHPQLNIKLVIYQWN